LVDKDERFLEIGELLVSSLGYRVVIAFDGADAVVKSAAELPDLILMDIDLPVINGLQAVAAIRKQSATQAIPVIAMTANTFLGYAHKYREFGFDGFLSKPFTLQQLQQSLDGLLQSR